MYKCNRPGCNKFAAMRANLKCINCHQESNSRSDISEYTPPPVESPRMIIIDDIDTQEPFVIAPNPYHAAPSMPDSTSSDTYRSTASECTPSSYDSGSSSSDSGSCDSGGSSD